MQSDAGEIIMIASTPDATIAGEPVGSHYSDRIKTPRLPPTDSEDLGTGGYNREEVVGRNRESCRFTFVLH